MRRPSQQQALETQRRGVDSLQQNPPPSGDIPTTVSSMPSTEEVWHVSLAGMAIFDDVTCCKSKFRNGASLLAFDFIIVGAGTAGCLLADRLTKSGKYSVLL